MTVNPTSSSNAAVAGAIRAHHAQLSAQLRELTAAVCDAALAGEPGAPRELLHRWYATELLPHAAAEERTLYRFGAELDVTRLLVEGMLAEHQALIGLVAELARARGPLATVAVAASAQELFTVHLAKENDLLLPALERAGVNLAELLEGMHELLGHHGDTPVQPADRGCGCNCGHGHSAQPAPLSSAGSASR